MVQSSSMKAIGVDIIDIERIGQSVDRYGNRFLERVFTEQELAYCNNRIESLAARWAAKEAVAKALGTGIGAVNWREIEVVNDANRRPALHLHGAAADLAAQLGIEEFAISLSHAKDYAVAFVVGEMAG
jgi:holo-[acyl-carrier protein] synthase